MNLLVGMLNLNWIYLFMKKADLKGITDIDSSTQTSKTDLTSFKTKNDEWNMGKINNVPVKLKVSNAADNDVVKKTVY